MASSSVSSPKPMEDENNLDKLVTELHALKKLYNLLQKNSTTPDQPASHLLDEKSSEMLKKLLDDATKQVFDCQAKIISCTSETSKSKTPRTVEPPEKPAEPVITGPKTEPSLNRLKSIRSGSSGRHLNSAHDPAQKHQPVEPLEPLNRVSTGSTKTRHKRHGKAESIGSEMVGQDPIKSLQHTRSSINRASKARPLADRTAEIPHRNDGLVDKDLKRARLNRLKIRRSVSSGDSSWPDSGSHSPTVLMYGSSGSSSSISWVPRKPTTYSIRRRKPSHITSIVRVVPKYDRPTKSSKNHASHVIPLVDRTAEIVYDNHRFVDKDIKSARLKKLKARRYVSSTDSSWSNYDSHSPTVSISSSNISSSSISWAPKRPSAHSMIRRKPSQIKSKFRTIQKANDRMAGKESCAFKQIKPTPSKHGSLQSKTARLYRLKARRYVASSDSSWSNSDSLSPTLSISDSISSSSSVSWAPKKPSACSTRRRKPSQIKSMTRIVQKSDGIAEKKSCTIAQIKPSSSKHGSSRSNHLKSITYVSSSNSSWFNSGSNSPTTSISGSNSSSKSISNLTKKPSTSTVRIVQKNDQMAKKKTMALKQIRPSPAKPGPSKSNHLNSSKQSKVKTERRKALPPPPPMQLPPPQRHNLPLVSRQSAPRRRPTKSKVQKKEKKKEQGKFRKLTNKLAIIFHHHHHHHHIHAGEDGGAGGNEGISIWKQFKAVLHLGSGTGEERAGKENHHGYLRVMIEGLLQQLWGMRWRRKKKPARRRASKKKRCWAWFVRRGGVAVGGRRRVRMRLGRSDSRRRIGSGKR